jgi:hypothetical protein
VLSAALLHDTIEDTDTTPEEIEREFGAAIRSVVEEVTDDKTLPKAERKRLQIDATEKDPRGMVTLTMRPDKTRCPAQPATFELDTTSMLIRPLDRIVNVAAINQEQRQFQADQGLIEVVRTELARGGLKFTDLQTRVIAASGESKRIVNELLERYVSGDLDDPRALWIETRMRLNNIRRCQPSRSARC